MRKPNFIYAYLLPDISAVKVGHGLDPEQRMSSYTRKYGVSPREDSLKVWEMPSSGIASNIESACHDTLLASGFLRANLFDDDNEAKEIFLLGDFSYEDVLSLIIEEIDHNLEFLRRALEGKRYGEEHKRQKKRDEIKKIKEKEREEKVKNLTNEIRKGFTEHYTRYIEFERQRAEHDKKFECVTVGKIREIFLSEKQKSPEVQFMEWSGFEKSISFLPNILKSSRPAREFYHHLFQVYEYDLIQEATDHSGIDIHRPGGYELPIPYKEGFANMKDFAIGSYGYDIPDLATYEVYLCFGGGIEIIPLLTKNPILVQLVAWARANPPIEATL